MSAGAVPMAPRLCREDGCSLPVRARGKCSRHYQRWLAANPDARTMVQMRRAILDTLPARPHQIKGDAGIDIQAVKRHTKAMQKEGLIHIGRYDPPNVTGYKWEPVWYAGPGQNARITKQMRIEYRCLRQRMSYRRRAMTRLGWLGALGVPIQATTSEAGA